jgi:hypothetical protein
LKTLIKSLALASFLVMAGGTLLPAPAQAQSDGVVFELRTYKATPGNFENLLNRFRNHTMALFEKHGMVNVGYWIPTDPAEAGDTLIYILRHESQEAATASWRAFATDPEWARVNEESNRDGSILQGVERKFMTAADFSQMK